ncbi:MAG: RNase P subunit p30 family protein [Candidatus Woesearchaeota archaeon]
MNFIDIVVPGGNEEEFVRMAEKLGVKGLVFLYDSEPANLNELRKKTRLKLFSGIIVKDMNRCGSLRKRFDILLSYPEKQGFESRMIDIVFDQEFDDKKDFMHSRNSGLNQVLAKLSKEKDKIIALDFGLLLSSKEQQRIMLGRFMQNIMLQKKYKFRMIIASFAENPFQMRAPKDLASLLTVLGADAGAAKKAMDELHFRLEKGLKA